jgi:hypothetical protein
MSNAPIELENVPEGHLLHWVTDEAPKTEDHVPGGHPRQAFDDLAGRDDHVPFGQRVQDAARNGL